tara:strand:- start:729 stop:1385 length:657 start_codon:yes stop_codon:yes gene_type:complete
MNYSKRFSSKFFAKLLQPEGQNPQRDRASSLSIVFELLDQKEDKSNYLIVETGCMRGDHKPVNSPYALGDDGASTYIFDDFINFYDGEVLSVDIKQENVDYADKYTSDRTSVFCQDSVEFLWGLSEKEKIDFLYLDSYDFEADNPIPSQLHHVKELCAVMKNLKKGTIIVVDDHLNTPEFESLRSTFAKGGKAAFVENFMDSIGAECLHDGYQIVWRL